MKKLSFAILCMIVAIQIAIGYVVGQSFEPFNTLEWFVWAMLPAIIITGLGFSFGGPLWEKTEAEILQKNGIATITDVLFWFWLIASMLFLILTIYLLGQALLPVAERIDSDGNSTLFILSSLSAYFVTIYGLWRRLRINWK